MGAPEEESLELLHAAHTPFLGGQRIAFLALVSGSSGFTRTNSEVHMQIVGLPVLKVNSISGNDNLSAKRMRKLDLFRDYSHTVRKRRSHSHDVLTARKRRA